MMRNDKDNVIVTKKLDFSVTVIAYCEVLEQDRKYVIARQLLRSATSIGANVFEAQNAKSKADFIHKMKIAAKEASETLYWLILCERSKSYSNDPKLKADLDEILKILSKIIASSKGRLSGFIWSALFAFSNFQIFKLTHS